MTKEERLKLRPDQIGDLAFAMAHPRSLNLSDPGTGKTPTACLLMYWLWDAKKSRTFWVMPSSLMKKNRDELLRWSKFCPEQVVIYEGTPDRRAKMRHANAAVWIMTFNMFAKEWKLPATEVHHLTYDHWRDELLFELVAVCRDCHAKCHPAEDDETAALEVEDDIAIDDELTTDWEEFSPKQIS